MDLPEPLRAGFALAATIAGDKGAQCAARGLHPGTRAALTALPEALAMLDKGERRERVRALAARFGAQVRVPVDHSLAHTPARPTVARVLRAPVAPQGPAREDMAMALQALTSAHTQQRADTERAAVAIGLQVASHIVGRTLEVTPSDIEPIVARLLATVRRASTLRLNLHPDDALVVQAALPSLAIAHGIAATIEIVSDPNMMRGDCVIESNVGDLDARLSTRLASIAKALEGSQP